MATPTKSTTTGPRTCKDLARHFGRDVRTIRRWLTRYRIKRVRPTKRYVFVSEFYFQRLERMLREKESLCPFRGFA